MNLRERIASRRAGRRPPMVGDGVPGSRSESDRPRLTPERRSGNERRSVPRWIEYTRADDRRGKALDHS